ncbi:hypothetical protein Tco_0473206, partial [Tanacetum coccineum]
GGDEMRVVVAYGGGDEGLSWGSSRKRGDCRGVAAVVEARGGGRGAWWWG